MKKTTVIIVAVSTFLFGILVGSYSKTCDCSKVENKLSVCSQSLESNSRDYEKAKNNLSVCMQVVDTVPEITESCVNVMYAAFEQDVDKLQIETEKMNSIATKVRGLTEQIK